MNAPTYDSGSLALMLNELRLPTIGRLWPEFAQRADSEGWPATRFDSWIGWRRIIEAHA